MSPRRYGRDYRATVARSRDNLHRLADEFADAVCDICQNPERPVTTREGAVFMCDGCTRDRADARDDARAEHRAICVDEDGKVECICRHDFAAWDDELLGVAPRGENR